jgi:signal transduction histidine kinase
MIADQTNSRLSKSLQALGSPAYEIQIEIAQAGEALKRSEMRLAETQRISSTGSFLCRLAADQIAGSEELYRIFTFGGDATQFRPSRSFDLFPDGLVESTARAARQVLMHVPLCLCLSLLCAFLVMPAPALNQNRDFWNYAHSASRISKAIFKGPCAAIPPTLSTYMRILEVRFYPWPHCTLALQLHTRKMSFLKAKVPLDQSPARRVNGTPSFRFGDGIPFERGVCHEAAAQRSAFKTHWILGLGALMGASSFFWLCYWIRVHQVARNHRVRLDERLAERTRIARELHDTLLQTIQGSKVVADAAIRERCGEEHRRATLLMLSNWLGQAMQEGREALNSLRATATNANGLAEDLRLAAVECTTRHDMAVHLSIKGESLNMHPIVRDEVYRIGAEAIRNACMHSRGACLQISMEYSHDFLLRIDDDGIGMSSDVTEDGVAGHFGIRGMRERAQRIGAKLSIMSAAGAGSHISLALRARFIYEPRSIIYLNFFGASS